jgi:hypothetical protein
VTDWISFVFHDTSSRMKKLKNTEGEKNFSRSSRARKKFIPWCLKFWCLAKIKNMRFRLKIISGSWHFPFPNDFSVLIVQEGNHLSIHCWLNIGLGGCMVEPLVFFTTPLLQIVHKQQSRVLRLFNTHMLHDQLHCRPTTRHLAKNYKNHLYHRLHVMLTAGFNSKTSSWSASGESFRCIEPGGSPFYYPDCGMKIKDLYLTF